MRCDAAAEIRRPTTSCCIAQRRGTDCGESVYGCTSTAGSDQLEVPISDSFLEYDKTPLTHTVSMVFTPVAGTRGLTWMIWFGGGGGVWMQAP